jgi:DNA-binding NtrC family response regulator
MRIIMDSNIPVSILTIDLDQEIRLLNDMLTEFIPTIHLVGISSPDAALACLNDFQWVYDIIIIGSSFLLSETPDFISGLEKSKIFPKVPIIILTEFQGEEKYLQKVSATSACYIERPFEIAQIPSFINNVLKFWSNCN